MAPRIFITKVTRILIRVTGFAGPFFHLIRTLVPSLKELPYSDSNLLTILRSPHGHKKSRDQLMTRRFRSILVTKPLREPSRTLRILLVIRLLQYCGFNLQWRLTLRSSWRFRSTF